MVKRVAPLQLGNAIAGLSPDLVCSDCQAAVIGDAVGLEEPSFQCLNFLLFKAALPKIQLQLNLGFF